MKERCHENYPNFDERNTAVTCKQCRRPIKQKIISRAHKARQPTPTHCYDCSRPPGKLSSRERKVLLAKARALERERISKSGATAQPGA